MIYEAWRQMQRDIPYILAYQSCLAEGSHGLTIVEDVNNIILTLTLTHHAHR